MRIVVIGGYGNFGARICRGLAPDPSLQVIATGRNPSSAPGDFEASHIETAALDITHPQWQDALRHLSPDLVIHCAGPFQQQGYEVARAVLACGAHYIDLSDGRDFVAGFAAAVNADAVRASRIAITGASTLPALSSAVVDEFRDRFSLLDSIDTVIAPGQHAPRGVATMRAVLSYAGRPFPVWHDGAWQKMYGWMHLERVRIGSLPARLSAVCDVPDLALFPSRYPGIRSARFRAALEVGMQHRALAMMASIQRAGISLPIDALAPLMERMAGWFNAAGTGNGGMMVTMAGTAQGEGALTLRWSVLAPDNHGPEIPCMPAILLARKLAAGQLSATGAMACMGLLMLQDFAPEFAKWGMRTNVEEVR
ncbi:MAG: saccharopine dehydrogenase NADP-binding domain-containing protein [Betaproteobacteria bacterium]